MVEANVSDNEVLPAALVNNWSELVQEDIMSKCRSYKWKWIHNKQLWPHGTTKQDIFQTTVHRFYLKGLIAVRVAGIIGFLASYEIN